MIFMPAVSYELMQIEKAGPVGPALFDKLEFVVLTYNATAIAMCATRPTPSKIADTLCNWNHLDFNFFLA